MRHRQPERHPESNAVNVMDPPKMSSLLRFFGFQCSTKLFVATLFSITVGVNSQAETPDFESSVRPILEQHCFKCHGVEKQKGKIRFDNVSIDLLKDQRAVETWHEVRSVINLGEMPPEDEGPLSDSERAILLSWLNDSIQLAATLRRSKGGRIVVRRLNRIEYQNTMRDLFKMDIDYVQDLPPDGVSVDGMTNNGSALRMTSIQMEYYLAAARNALDQALTPSTAPPVFHHRFDKTNETNWPAIVPANRLGRGREFIARIKKDYPEWGAFRIRIRARAELPLKRGPIPRLRVTVGYRPDTLVMRRTLTEIDITKEGSHEYEFEGRVENFPLPVRGQGKFPGLVVSVINAYDEHASPWKRVVENEKGEKQTLFDEDPNYPYLVVESLEFEGPTFEFWPPRHHRDILPDSVLLQTDESAYARKVVKSFLKRAWRRPPSPNDTNRFVTLFESIRPGSLNFLEAIKETFAVALVAPQFLYLLEPAPDELRSIDNFELASRLSYFLWSSMPDDELVTLAGLGILQEQKVLNAQIDRMVQDPKAWQFVDQFTSQWLDLGAIDRIVIDRSVYPHFHEGLKRDLRGESQHYFAEILRNNLSAQHFLKSNFVTINDNLARHYGMESIPGGTFRRVDLRGIHKTQRGGLLSQAAILMANSTGRDSSLVKRAVFVRKRLLNDPPAPPPPNVPELKTADPDFAQLPIREQLELHNDNPACADCHRGIDPWGYAIEHFDAIGLWRDSIVRSIKGQDPIKLPIDSRSRLPGGHEVDGIEELKDFLLDQRSEQFARAFVHKLMTYSLGRTLEFSDEADIEILTRDFIKDDMRVAGLIKSIAASRAFRNK
jgi:hypothetical protein